MSSDPVRVLWRISKHADLSGAGGEIVSGRWHRKGLPVVYLAETPSGALLESLVHLEFTQRKRPETYTLLKVEIAEQVDVLEIEVQNPQWKSNDELTRRLGSGWLTESKTLLARVPSVVMPFTWNLLMNPKHNLASRVRIAAVYEERFDSRLFRFGSR